MAAGKFASAMGSKDTSWVNKAATVAAEYPTLLQRLFPGKLATISEPLSGNIDHIYTVCIIYRGKE